jgi:hypothetical protein
MHIIPKKPIHVDFKSKMVEELAALQLIFISIYAGYNKVGQN